MCLIITANKFPKDEELLKRAQWRNSDGIGIAYLTDTGKIQYFKGLTLDELMEFKDLEATMVIHFRSASIGPKCKELTHPFPITDEVELDLSGLTDKVMVHNGHMADWQSRLMQSFAMPGTKCPDGVWSDSRAYAFLINVYGDNILNIIGGDSRWAILSKDGIRHFGNWYKFPGEEGAHLSNDNCTHSYVTTYNNTNNFPTRNLNTSYYGGMGAAEVDDALQEDRFFESFIASEKKDQDGITVYSNTSKKEDKYERIHSRSFDSFM